MKNICRGMPLISTIIIIKKSVKYSFQYNVADIYHIYIKI